MKRNKLYKIIALFISACLLAIPGSLMAGEKQDADGWELSGKYNTFYKNSERDRLKGRIAGIEEIIPLEGMSPGIALEVKDSDGEKVMVHLAPKWYVDAHPTGLRKGDKVKIKGVWAEINGEDVFLAAKVKRGEYDEYKVRRTKDGFPFWAMSKEELAKELAGE